MENATDIFNRLLEVLGAHNLDEAANKLDINPSTLRGRKSRGAVPFEEIVQKLNSKELVYVLKGDRIIEGKVAGGVDPELLEDAFERFSVGLVERIEAAPFSRAAKLRMIDALLRIVDQDLAESASPPADPASAVDDQS